MNKLFHRLAFVAGLIVTVAVPAQVPAGAPAGTTGLCKDGTYYSGAEKKGACRGHKGVKDWYGAADAKATPAAAPAPQAAAPAKAATPAKGSKPDVAQAPGGGAGQVWVNTNTKVYHCAGTKWYGKTKKGEYMTEAAAKSAGNHADHGKACS